MIRVICLEIPTVFWLGGGTISQLLDILVYWVNGVRQIEIHTAEPTVPGPSVLEVQLAIEKIKKRKITR
jgi:hypothetical protein